MASRSAPWSASGTPPGLVGDFLRQKTNKRDIQTSVGASRLDPPAQALVSATAEPISWGNVARSIHVKSVRPDGLKPLHPCQRHGYLQLRHKRPPTPLKRRAPAYPPQGEDFLLSNVVVSDYSEIITIALANQKQETQHSVLRFSALFKGGGPAVRLVVGSAAGQPAPTLTTTHQLLHSCNFRYTLTLSFPNLPSPVDGFHFGEYDVTILMCKGGFHHDFVQYDLGNCIRLLFYPELLFWLWVL
jgi:hypothetical protein